MSFTRPCSKCGAPLTTADNFCRFCGDGAPRAAPAAVDDITQLILAHRKIEAIKVYRDRHKVGLREAKDFVESLEAKLGTR